MTEPKEPEAKESKTKSIGMGDAKVDQALRRGGVMPTGTVLVAHAQSQSPDEILARAEQRAAERKKRATANRELDRASRRREE